MSRNELNRNLSDEAITGRLTSHNNERAGERELFEFSPEEVPVGILKLPFWDGLDSR